MNAFMQKLGMMAAALLTFLSASAYDFEANGIYYNITDPTAKTVEVTKGDDSYTGEVNIPASVSYNGVQYAVTTIGEKAFSYLTGLVSITFPNSVTTIGEMAFANCIGLVSITIPNTVTTIGEDAFYNCRSLSSIIIPNSVTTISNGAFSECHSLTSVTLPSSMTTIGEDAFDNCSSLSSIIIPNSVTTIKKGAFSRCSSLTSIKLPSSLTTIGEYAFAGCRSLTSITLPNSVTTIGEFAFDNCDSLANIVVEDDNQTFSSIDGLLYDKSQTTLIWCPGGKAGEIDIPNSVTTIGVGAFSWCCNIASINIPNSVTTIGEHAFDNCSRLSSIIIPNSVLAIGSYAFTDCSSLTSITSLAVTPPECGERVYEGIDKQACTLYVPKGSKETYQQAPEWKDFVLVEEVEAGIDAVEAAADGTAEVFNLTGAKVADKAEGLPAGVYIIRQGTAARKTIVR